MPSSGRSWRYRALSGGIGLFALFGAPFVLIDLYMIFGRFFVASRHRARTWYGITSSRAIIVKGKRFDKVQSKDLDSINELDLSLRSDGSGSIQLGRANGLQVGILGRMAEAGWPMSQRNASPRLALIEDAREVYDTLRREMRRDE